MLQPSTQSSALSMLASASSVADLDSSSMEGRVQARPDAVASHVLGVVERAVGAHDQPVRVTKREAGTMRAERAVYGPRPELPSALCARADARHNRRAIDSGLRGLQKLFAAVARSRSTPAQLFAQTIREDTQLHVAGIMAERVVDALEVVYIEQDQGDGLAHTRRQMQITLKL